MSGINMRQQPKVMARNTPVIRGFISLLAAGMLILSAQMTSAQNATKASFTPVKFVNNQAITGFELNQRMGFLELLGFDGDLKTEAMIGLIDDRLRLAMAKSMGLSLSPEDVMAGMEEFASRGTLDAQGFLQAIGEQGIAPETFRDFVSAGLIWRRVISTRFGDSVVISDAAVDRALTNMIVTDAQTVTLAEIVLNAVGDRRNQALALARNLQIDFIKGRSFSDAVRAVSIGPTAGSGGTIAAKRLSELPDDVAVLVRGLAAGQISTPIIMDDKLYIYQMVENGSTPVAGTGAQVVDYAQISLSGGAEAVADLRANVDGCDDLYDYASKNGLTVTRNNRGETGGLGVLQSLDAGEIAGPLNGTSGPMAVMLCARGIDPQQTASRDEVKLLLKNQRLAAMSEVFLSELRADALIRDP
jgi:peptidyl-prolyl cis-trans isomerase SurA